MMNTKIENKEGNIICTITSLEYSHTQCSGRVYMNTNRVRKLLIENGHNPGDVVVDSRVDNCDNQLEGSWVFKDNNFIVVKPKEEIVITHSKDHTKSEPKQNKPSTRRKNTRKSKKSLDNFAKDVIIEE